MKVDILEASWLAEQPEITLEELAEVSGVPEELLSQMVETGALVPVASQAARWTFTLHCVSTVRAAGRLRNDFELDAGGVSLTLRLLERIETLEHELRELRASR